MVSARAARFVPLAQGHGTASISALHLEPGARIQVPSIIVFSACMRAVFGPEQPYAMAFEEGAIALIVEVLKASIDFGSDRAGKSARQTKTPVAMIAPA